jgi:hypothetical protein
MNNGKLFISIFIYSLILWGCKETSKTSKRPTEPPSGAQEALMAKNPIMRFVPASESGLTFTNQIHETIGNNLITNPNIYNGGGIAVIDINNDNQQDLYFVASNGENKLYLNEGKLKFKDITESAGVTAPEGFKTAVSIVDINQDGFQDIYLCRGGHNIPGKYRTNLLFVNNGNMTFTESAAAYGLADSSLAVGASFFDYDLDGDLDLYLLNTPSSQSYINKLDYFVDPKTKKPVANVLIRNPIDSDRFYKNNGNSFEDITTKAGVYNMGYSQSVSVSDFNGDGYPDVYVANDYVQPDLLYINQKNGTFKEDLANWFGHTSQHTMGSDLADFDNDGMVDLVALDMLPDKHYRRKTTTNTNDQVRYNTIVQSGYFEPVVRNVLQRNNGNGSFSEIGCLAGVYKTDWSWGCLFFDIDNDGLKDLAISNGFRREVTDADFVHHTYGKLTEMGQRKPFERIEEIVDSIPFYKVRNVVYRNAGDWTFEDKSGDWFDALPSWSNGSVYADLDADGDMDWVVNNLEEPPFLYENLQAGKPGANYLQLQLHGTKGNPFGVGAKVEIRAGGVTQFQEMYLTRGIFSSQEPLIHFGLGSASTVDLCQVRWPDGKVSELHDVKANQRLQVSQSEANGIWTSPSASSLFQPYNNSGIDFVHSDTEFDDFNVRFLQPWRLTDLGPALSAADVNKDGLDDFFVGSGFNYPAALYIQQGDGTFHKSSEISIETDQRYEDHGSVFFDFDKDGDEDLLVVSGGAEATTDVAWQARLYQNDGRGTFTPVSNGVLPEIRTLGMRAAVHDMDGDGDMDVVIGGRMDPAKYPLSPKSIVLKNENGRFVDATAEWGGDFTACGMIADLTWADLNGDGTSELVAAGEWTRIQVFALKGGKLTDVTADFGLEKSSGLWNKIAVNDLDGDGDLDIVSGNFGLNSSMVTSEEEPFSCFASDIDGNGSIDPILAYYEEGILYPFRHRDILIKQVPKLKKKYVYYKTFGLAILEDLYEPGQLDTTLRLTAEILNTCWWENKNGQFVRHDFPPQAQVSPVQGIAVYDFNGDGKKDVFLVGNKYHVEVETGRADAGIGCLLAGNGKGGFDWVPNTVSGLWAQKEARDVLVLKGPDGPVVVVGNHNNRLDVYRQSPKVNQ